MQQHVGLDVSQKDGRIVFEGEARSGPGALAKVIRRRAPQAARIDFDTDTMASWLWHELERIDLLVVCIDARHDHAALSVCINKSDSQRCCGLAELMRIGRYREVSAVAAMSREALLSQI